MMNERTNERTDGQFDGWMDGWMGKRMNESNGRKKNLKINFYKLYLQVASYADVLRALLSVWGKNAQRSSKKRLRGRLMSRLRLFKGWRALSIG